MLPLLVTVFGLPFLLVGSDLKLEDISLHLSTNASIVWKAATNDLPKSYGVFTRAPRFFSPNVISNAILLASFPLPRAIFASTNILRLQDGEKDRWSRALNVLPESGQIDYEIRFDSGNPSGVPAAEEVSKRAWNYAARFEIGASELLEKPESRRTNRCDHKNTNQICSRRTFLTRKVDGIEMRDFGFGITIGGEGQIKRFELLWPELKLRETHVAASLEEIIRLIRANKAAVLPNENEPDYFARVKTLAKTKKLTLTKITPFYAEGRYGEPPEKQLSKLISPMVELEGRAELDDTIVDVRLLSPILTTDIARFLKQEKD